MRGEILCPECKESGRKPKVLGYYEDVMARQGYVDLYCKPCHKSIRIELRDLSVDQ